MTWKATHTVPDSGLDTFVDGQPSTPLDPGLEVEVAETSGEWARVVAANGWECWVRAQSLISISGPTAHGAAGRPPGLAGPPAGPAGPPAGPSGPRVGPPAPPPTALAGAPFLAVPPPKKRRIPATTIIIGVLVVLLVLAGGGYFLINAQASDVTLEMALSQGSSPFVSAPSPAASPGATATPTPAPTPPPTPAPTPVPRTGPNGVAIYGGTGNNRVCDKQKLIDFLTTHPAEGNAWASVEGISTEQIPSFINGLEPEVMSRDVRVTNHGFVNGHATAYQAVFQAGTAVLVNQYGFPVARCLCGNPLTPPTTARARYVGTPWPGFSETTIVIYVTPPGNIPNVPSTSSAGPGGASMWDGTYKTKASTLACTGNIPGTDFGSALQQIVPATGLVVSHGAVLGVAPQPIAIDSKGKAMDSYSATNGETTSVAFAFTHDASGAASFSGTIAIAVTVSQSGITASENCSLPLTGTR